MELDEYQELSAKTDRFPDMDDEGESVAIPIFGIVGEVGSLVACFKKLLRDQERYERFLPDLEEELGDVLWYLANLARKYGLSLNQIAESNLAKAQDRFGADHESDRARYYDDAFPEEEQLPRELTVQFGQVSSGAKAPDVCIVSENGTQIGDRLTDNARASDGYRFHDVFHMALAAHLAWSPVLRALLRRKRKSDAKVDEVEDGARAQIIEEAISLYVFGYAKDHAFLEGVDELDQDVLRTVRNLTAGLEVQDRKMSEWRNTFLKAYEVYRALMEHGGGTVTLSMSARQITFEASSL